MSEQVSKDEYAEKIARMLSGFCGVPPVEQERMIQRVSKLYEEQSSLLREAKWHLQRILDYKTTQWMQDEAKIALDKLEGVK